MLELLQIRNGPRFEEQLPYHEVRECLAETGRKELQCSGFIKGLKTVVICFILQFWESRKPIQVQEKGPRQTEI